MKRLDCLHAVTVLCIWLMTVTLTQTACVWPSYFDVSKQYWEYSDEERSWETDTKVDTDIPPQINGYYKSRELVTMLTNATLQMSYHKKLQRVWHEKYKCEKSFGNNVFLLKRVDVVMNLLPGDIIINKIQKSIKYRCMQLYKRSKFVVQWRLGNLQDNSHDCHFQSEGFRETPLVYFPVRNTRRDEKIFEYSDLLSQYPPCPELGGYLMKVYEANGTHVESHSCRNENPSPRFEMECTRGEGIQISPNSEPCPRYFTARNSGTKMYCLASWKQQKHTFTVLIAAEGTVHSFHCLRMSSDDPGKAVLFLDTICKTGEPLPKNDSYLLLSLRRKQVTSFCADFSDHCQFGANCSNVVEKAACVQTCNACPEVPSPQVTFNSDFVDQWLFQTPSSESFIDIHERGLRLPELGEFLIEDTPDLSVCNPAGKPFLDGSHYVLSSVEAKEGCTPRVIQLSVVNVSSSVILLHFTSPSTIRYNKYAFKFSTWCQNNRLEVENNAQLFRPYWPYSTRHSSSLNTDGWYTLVRSTTDIATESCSLTGYRIGYAANMTAKAYFNIQGKDFKCTADIRASETDEIALSFSDCDGNRTLDDINFECLANYNMTTDYTALTLRVSPSSATNLLDTRKFYCLLLPRYNLRNRLYIILNSAGTCDYPYAYFVLQNHQAPLIKMTFLHSLVGHANAIKAFNMFTFVVLLITVIYIY